VYGLAPIFLGFSNYRARQFAQLQGDQESDALARAVDRQERQNTGSGTKFITIGGDDYIECFVAIHFGGYVAFLRMLTFLNGFSAALTYLQGFRARSWIEYSLLKKYSAFCIHSTYRFLMKRFLLDISCFF